MKVSILSPVYNEALFIEQTIASVQAQSHQDWELLVVDDGSSDSTPKLVAEAAQSDPRIMLVSQGRKWGKVPAFNEAFTASSGDIVMILGGDDLLPRDSLSHRVAAFNYVDPNTPAVAFFKIRMFSENPRYDGIVHPRGSATSKCGGSLTVNRTLAELIFPIDETVAAEDVWLRYAALGLATTVIERPHIVLHYRIHEGNSNPRHLPFHRMTQVLHAEHRAFSALLAAQHLNLNRHTRDELQKLEKSEQLRYSGETLQLLLHSGLPLMDRLAMAAMSHPLLFQTRMRFYKFFSGRRGA